MNHSATNRPRRDIYREVTDRIVAELEQGVRPWIKPWNAAHMDGRVLRPLRHNSTPYRGINTLVLWGKALELGYGAPVWMTFRQALELGGHVRKGETSTLVVYANTLNRTAVDDATGEESPYAVHYLKTYPVFNVAQIEDLPATYYPAPEAVADAPARIAHAETFFAATGGVVRHGGDRAYYAQGSDHIQLPPYESFADPLAYYATEAHEFVHWTKHPTRLDRDLGRKRWGDAGYAMEELVAELGAAFISADLGLALEPRADHASYLAHWLEVLKADNRAIFAAAAHAQRAADYLHGATLPAPD